MKQIHPIRNSSFRVLKNNMRESVAFKPSGRAESQYRVDPPRAAITALHLRYMERTRLLVCCWGTWAHTCAMAARNSAAVRGLGTRALSYL
ncbi:hypothetical protein BaRGS_00015119 [Batillaria attramentaria]|uniref:Uncharacterized protein n=1 Tax=Batillaria attramentaria TaxID=370345 RepID=A0ABD0L2H3_9CAEN